MFIRRTITAFALFASFSAFSASNQGVVIATSSRGNEELVSKYSSQANQALSTLGYQVSFISDSAGPLRKGIPQVSSQAIFVFDEADPIVDYLEQKAKHLESGTSLFIFLNSHGTPPTAPESPGSAGIRIRSNRYSGARPPLSFDKMEKALFSALPPETKIRIGGVTCFGGGVHQLAFKHPGRACTFAATDFRTAAGMMPVGSAGYSEGFWREIEGKDKKFDFDHDGKTNLYEAQLSAIASDPYNSARGQLSSMAYVDFVLKEGAFAPIEFGVWGRFKLTLGAWEWPGEGKRNFLADLTFPFVSLDKSDHNEIHLSTEQDSRKLVAGLFDEIESLATAVDETREISRGSGLPKEFAPYFQASFADFKSRKDVLKDLALSYSQTSNLLSREWFNYKALPRSKRDEEKSASFVRQFSDLESDAVSKLATLALLQRLHDDVAKINRFNGVATDEQLRTFQALLSCEMDSL